MTGVIIGISLSWKYGKINNIKCLFLSQMFTISGIHVIHIHVLKKVMTIKPPSLWAFQVVQISQLSTMTNWISFCYTPSQQASRDCIAWQLIYEHVTDVNNRVRPRPPETTSYQALTLQKFDFSSKYISSIEVQCGVLTALLRWPLRFQGNLLCSI